MEDLQMDYTNKAQDIYQIWEGQDKPYYKENSVEEYEKETWGTMCVFNVTEPKLSVYTAKGENTGIGVIILPGGAYAAEGIYLEGHDLAKVLVEQGITAAVLKYRLPNPDTSDHPHLVPLADTRQALKLLRQLADKYGIRKDRVGLVGFSAGSHLAAVASLRKSNNPEENPNFAGYMYGVFDLSEETIQLFEKNMYHRKMTEEELTQNRILDLVNEETPPAFLVHAYNDDLVSVEESIKFAEKLNVCMVPVEMHLFPKGGHGFGIGRKADGTDQWVSVFVNWLKTSII
jgi:acetyl esterase/lipase